MKNEKKFVLVTGASKGFGRSIAIVWAKSCSSGSKMILTARSEEGLNETEKEIKSLNSDIKVVKFITDHGNPVKAEYEALFNREIKDPNDKYDSGFLFHNVGVVEPQGDNIKDYSNLEEMENYFRLNLFSVMIINSVFFPLKQYLSNPLVVINISSLASIQPIPSWGYYCMGKTARQMYFQIMAKEEDDVRVLNYSPGPMDTSAIDRLKESDKTIDYVKGFWTNLIEPTTSAEKMAFIIEKNEFQSGVQIDFFDDV
ncbi:sepiapterin reductase [Lepeophtheirus salmonis]|uniref:Sepiapterin reductase n=2 Tax=Lepeophtheirus salmonis TaxID=72036 RepID=C1BRX8_LEPSM|nr:sepiapterin reductase-like [Lepeophtheirus salmonis]XP_040569337.1 sepiapterin reductase-like [Lepeophtheirus salmonis]ACO11781.1 Sepiapterin reductase [Lepeophtheirus salmonis]ADD24077.1 Sepiapterin reductase [Lepeophtheirus salmonis]ADD38296.1 Sepiapterin reductase [Lepeophtheirus salmonis]